MMLVLGVNLISAVSIGNGKNVTIYCENFQPVIFNCGHSILNDSGIINRTTNIAYSRESIQYKLLILDKNGIKKMQKFSVNLINLNNSLNLGFDCSVDNSYNQKNIIDSSCNAHIQEEEITNFDNSVMSYYTCTLNVKDSMKGFYYSNFYALHDCEYPFSLTVENWSLNPNIIYPNPEAIIKYDFISKNLTVIGNSEKVSISKTEKCLNRGCTRKTENYTLVNEYGNKLYLLFQHDKSNVQESIKLLSLKYNSNKEIKINKLLIRDSKNELGFDFSNKTASISLDTNKKTNKTKIQTKTKKINNTVINTNWNIEIKTLNGSLNYNLSHNINQNKPIETENLLNNSNNIIIKNNNSQVLPDNNNLSINMSAAQEINNSINQFALDLYSQYKDDPEYKDDNIFFSPFSIESALSIAYEGARGKTADEIQKVIHIPVDSNVRRPAFENMNYILNKPNQSYNLSTVNALWAEKTYPFLEDYKNTIYTYYNGNITNLDFKNEAEKSTVIINSWVENKTDNKITNLIPSGAINQDTRLVITNAIYFKGNWVNKFNENNTIEKSFTLNNNLTKKVQMMSLLSSHNSPNYNYLENEDLQVLELPYSGDDISMLILLPKSNDIRIAESYLSTEKLDFIKNNLRQSKVNIYLPKFKFETDYIMSNTLSKMGMPTAFSPKYANFSGMDGSSNLSISQVIHKAYIDVNEDGTKAAAATGIMVAITTSEEPRPVQFNADHSFIFMIQDKRTNTILFLGRVSNP